MFEFIRAINYSDKKIKKEIIKRLIISSERLLLRNFNLLKRSSFDFIYTTLSKHDFYFFFLSFTYIYLAYRRILYQHYNYYAIIVYLCLNYNFT